jgi:hypothetical protein
MSKRERGGKEKEVLQPPISHGLASSKAGVDILLDHETVSKYVAPCPDCPHVPTYCAPHSDLVCRTWLRRPGRRCMCMCRCVCLSVFVYVCLCAYVCECVDSSACYL